MKHLLTTIAAATVILGTSVIASHIDLVKFAQPEADTMLACLWFPVCKDPDYKQPVQLEEPAVNELDQDSLYACLWFPVCKDPDQPAGSAAVA